MTAKVIPMKPTKPASPRKINQPEGWKDSVGLGFLGAKGAQGQHVPLVFVHDLAAWMLASKPLKQVTQDICTAIERHGLDGLFYTKTDDWAIACAAPSEWDAFAGKTDASKIAASLGVAWNMSPWELERLVNTPGQQVEFSAENSSPFEFSRRKGSHISSIAVTHELAHKLWGWGTVDAAAVDANAASAPPVAKQKKLPQREHCPEWTGARLKARRDELKRNGEKKHTQVLMAESGLQDREIRRRISEHDAGSAAMAGMASQLQLKKPKAA